MLTSLHLKNKVKADSKCLKRIEQHKQATSIGIDDELESNQTARHKIEKDKYKDRIDSQSNKRRFSIKITS